ncbi:ELKS/Rab6-interacting/CAST family member 1-like isoform X2 [Mizuhopecten yessoensis]|uniref:ELKS/Rab6-interacting/CAST family member 1-like isoform X2 n=1 Tax=Mizuhopecten yessoensis TaxID=6573 RepID=UPI000B45D1F9|nr:ELKS/Rab6-interacting/CAST family member 1-like isoform X2 [Mizuhopecten yessoensis]
MADSGRITMPIGVQPPDVLEWSRTLRSRSPSPTRMNGLRSRSPSPTRLSSARGVYMTDVPTSAGLPKYSVNKMKKSKSGSSAGLRKSTGSLAATFNGTSSSGKLNKSGSGTHDLGNIEAEYIKNLQQQIYFLELESNYLREQARKATEMHPHMTAEAERMLVKLRAMQSEMDNAQLECKSKDSSIAQSICERERLAERIRDEEVNHQRNKRQLMDEIIALKKTRDALEHDMSNKDAQVSEARRELDMSATAIRNAELKISTLKTQLDQRTEQHKMTQIALDEKRSECLSTETQLREIEEKYYNNTVQIQDKLSNDLREEIRLLRQKLKETEMNADHDRYLKSKMSEDSTNLARENALLEQKLQELESRFIREKEIRESQETRHGSHVSELVQLRDKEKEARFELQHTQDLLRKEQERNRLYSEKLVKQEAVATSLDLSVNTSRSRITELESYQSGVEHENAQLRKDKTLLVDHVSDLQRKLETKDRDINTLRSQMHLMESKVQELQHLKQMESSVHTQKWEEFEKLAESMRNLSHTMSTTGTSSSNVLQY